MFHILVGFESHRKDSPGVCLYTGCDSQKVADLVGKNREKFGTILLYKNPTPSKRYPRVSDPEEVYHFPEEPEASGDPSPFDDTASQAEIARLTAELAAQAQAAEDQLKAAGAEAHKEISKLRDDLELAELKAARAEQAMAAAAEESPAPRSGKAR